MKVELVRLRPADVEAVAADVVDVYPEAFGAAPYFEREAEVARFASDALPRHAERRDFRLVVVLEAGEVCGFAYGCTGEAGRWWHDWVVSELGPPAAAEWGQRLPAMGEVATGAAATEEAATDRSERT